MDALVREIGLLCDDEGYAEYCASILLDGEEGALEQVSDMLRDFGAAEDAMCLCMERLGALLKNDSSQSASQDNSHSTKHSTSHNSTSHSSTSHGSIGAALDAESDNAIVIGQALDDVDAFDTEVFERYLAQQQEEDSDDSEREWQDGTCEMCKRDVKLTFHHLIPKEVHDQVLKRYAHLVDLCPPARNDKQRLLNYGTMIVPQPKFYPYVVHLNRSGSAAHATRPYTAPRAIYRSPYITTLSLYCSSTRASPASSTGTPSRSAAGKHS
ncbi:MAG: hypothetical protein MHM6MM_003400 [Cercozoa sp. M6MM]